ncbi:amidase [Devosia sp. 1566]|uniref:amidase n=1 Tax=Devosia sp. 1566 TaxID=2499144 RepID=UPI000FD837B1|nr:amidase [Devosia sp. 1566]
MSHGTGKLAFASANDLLEGYRHGTISPVDALDAVLDQLDRLEPVLNAFCVVDKDGARQQAEASASRWREGQPKGLLDGVPVSIKDIILTAGWPTLRGSRTVDPNQQWNEDGPAVARLREHGAVLFGKTTTPEFAAKGVTDSPLTGITRNPWNTDLTPGGSSGGAGAAVATGIGPLALATDAGGSIRIPASFSGVFGHRPSAGRVAMYPPTPYASLAAFGPMSRTVRDAALMLSVIAQPDVRDWEADPTPPLLYADLLDKADPSTWRIAWSPTLGYVDLHPEVRAIVTRAVEVFRGLGATVEEVEHVFEDPWPAFHRFKRGLTAFAFRNVTPSQYNLMDSSLVEDIEESRGATLEEHLAAQVERAMLARRMGEFHQRFDLLLTPTLAVPPFAVGRNSPDGYNGRSWYGFTYPFNLTRQPAASVPCGLTEAGLPVGLQIVGPPRNDLIVLQAAHAYERQLPWQRFAPLATRTNTP